MTDDVQEVQQVELSANEVEAKKFGWVPKEDFAGDENTWRSADDFLARGREINGFLRKDLDKIKRADEMKAAELVEIRQTIAEFRQYHNETEARAYKRATDDLKKQKVEAIEQGDGVRVVEIDDELESIKEAQKPIKQETKKNQVSLFDNWVLDNQWYANGDSEIRDGAEEIGIALGKENPSLEGRPFLDEVARRVKEMYADKFSNPNRSNNSVGTSSDGRAPSTNKKSKTYANLPAEEKVACDRFVKQKLMTQEQYVSEYQWD